jgi:hypothetical protein
MYVSLFIAPGIMLDDIGVQDAIVNNIQTNKYQI